MRLGLKLAGMILIPMVLIWVVWETASISEKSEPSMLTPEMQGVLKYDPAKAYDGINITYGYTEHSGCLIFNNAGTKSRNVPGQWCWLLPGEGLISGEGERVRFLDTALNQKWKRDFLFVHHEIAVVPEKREMFILETEWVTEFIPGIIEFV